MEEKTGVKCDRCDSLDATRRQQRTAYVDEESNFATLCPQCQELEDEFWDEMWSEYYAGRL